MAPAAAALDLPPASGEAGGAAGAAATLEVRVSDDKPTLERAVVNGYDIIRVADGPFNVWNHDRDVAGPFETFDEAAEAAENLPKGTCR